MPVNADCEEVLEQHRSENVKPHDFQQYVALGDSISIDLYPSIDEGSRRGVAGIEGLGAASLLFENHDEIWPEFTGRDLSTRFPNLEFFNLAMDGATTSGVLSTQLPAMTRNRAKATLVTLTIGGNDLLSLLDDDHEAARQSLCHTIENLRRIIVFVRDQFPVVTTVVGTVYDPTDGTADLGDGVVRRALWQLLSTYNRSVAEIVTSHHCLLADIHGHFLGHGLSQPNAADRWYWDTSIIEPNARGASEVRRLWLRALDPPRDELVQVHPDGTPQKPIPLRSDKLLYHSNLRLPPAPLSRTMPS